MKRRGFLGLFGAAAAAVPAMALASKLPESVPALTKTWEEKYGEAGSYEQFQADFQRLGFNNPKEISNPHTVTREQLGASDEEDLATLIERVRRRNRNNEAESLLRFHEALRRR